MRHGQIMTAPGRRVAVPLFVVFLLLVSVIGVVFFFESRRARMDVETAYLDGRMEAKAIAMLPLKQLRARIAAQDSVNDSRIYALFENDRQVVGPALSDRPPATINPELAVSYRLADGATVYGGWQVIDNNTLLFYGLRMAPAMRRAYAMAAAILGGGVIVGSGLAIWAVLIERQFRLRLRKLEAQLGRFSQGDLEARLPAGGSDDVDRMSHSVNIALGRVQRLMTSLRFLSDQIAHEMRGGVGRLQRRVARAQDASTDDVRKRWLSDAYDECQAMLAAIDAMLALSTIETWDLAGLPPVSLNEQVARTAEMMQLLADERDMTVRLALQPIEVVGEQGLLTQMFANLLQNAVKYGPAGSEIQVALTAVGAWAQLVVQDSGQGVPVEDREAIFLPRRRLSRDSEIEGFGYGLAIVRSIVTAHGGKIWVEEAAPGARFVVWLPLSVNQPSASKAS